MTRHKPMPTTSSNATTRADERSSRVTARSAGGGEKPGTTGETYTLRRSPPWCPPLSPVRPEPARRTRQSGAWRGHTASTVCTLRDIGRSANPVQCGISVAPARPTAPRTDSGAREGKPGRRKQAPEDRTTNLLPAAPWGRRSPLRRLPPPPPLRHRRRRRHPRRPLPCPPRPPCSQTCPPPTCPCRPLPGTIWMVSIRCLKRPPKRRDITIRR